MAVYLLHLDEPYRAPSGYEYRHYLGWTRCLEKRLAYHGTSSGAKLLYAARQQGVSWHLARLWPDGDPAQEKRIKRTHNLAQYCPECRAAWRARRAGYSKRKEATV